jgi:hypothetical protein
VKIINLIKKYFMEEDKIESSTEEVAESGAETCTNCTTEVTDCSVCHKGAVVE